MEEQNKQQQVQIHIPVDKQPSFSNTAQIQVSDDSVSVQFAYVRPNTGQGVMVAEVVLTPQHAIKFQKALDETIKKHFTRHLPQ
jgi:hypothetical protein